MADFLPRVLFWGLRGIWIIRNLYLSFDISLCCYLWFVRQRVEDLIVILSMDRGANTTIVSLVLPRLHTFCVKFCTTPCAHVHGTDGVNVSHHGKQKVELFCNEKHWGIIDSFDPFVQEMIHLPFRDARASLQLCVFKLLCIKARSLEAKFLLSDRLNWCRSSASGHILLIDFGEISKLLSQQCWIIANKHSWYNNEKAHCGLYITKLIPDVLQ